MIFLKTIQTKACGTIKIRFNKAIVDLTKIKRLALLREENKINKTIRFWLNMSKASNAIKMQEFLKELRTSVNGIGNTAYENFTQ